MQSLLDDINPISEVNNSNWDVGLTNFLKYFLEEINRPTNCVAMINFAQAAIVLQKSVNIYEIKVDYLWQLMEQLLDVLKVSKSVGEGAGTDPVLNDENVEGEPPPGKRSRGRRKKSSSELYVVEEFCQIQDKVSVKSLDLPKERGNTADVRNHIIKSAVFGRMVNLKKKREYDLYYYDNNGECMGNRDDFRSSWAINEQCALIEDRLDDSVLMPPPAVEEAVTASSARRNLLAVLSNDDAAIAEGGSPVPVNENGPLSPVENTSEDPDEDMRPVTPLEDANEPPSPAEDAPGHPTPPSESPKTGEVEGAGDAEPLLLDTPPDSGAQNCEQGGEADLANGAPELTEGAGSGLAGEPGEPVEPGEPGEPPPELAEGASTSQANQQEQGRALRERPGDELPRDKISTMNYLFSKSVLESLEDITNTETLTVAQRVIAQSRKNKRKGLRYREVEEDGDIVAFEEIDMERPAAAAETAVTPVEQAQTPTHIPATPTLGVPTPTLGVPTPPSTPGSHAMSPDPVTRTPCTAAPSSPTRIFEQEEPLTLEAFRPNEKELSDRAARVAAWHKSINRRLQEADARVLFNVHTYSSKVIDCFPSIDSTLPFEELVTGMDESEVSRVFLTSLMLANTRNVELLVSDPSPLPINCLSLKLISTQRHEKELEAFCAPSIDSNRSLSGGTPTASSSGEPARKRKHTNDSARGASSLPGTSGEFARKRKHTNDNAGSAPTKQTRLIPS